MYVCVSPPFVRGDGHHPRRACLLFERKISLCAARGKRGRASEAFGILFVGEVGRIGLWSRAGGDGGAV